MNIDQLRAKVNEPSVKIWYDGQCIHVISGDKVPLLWQNFFIVLR